MLKRFDNIPREFEAIKDKDETIYWVDQPAFVPFILSGGPFLIFGIVWFVISSSFFGVFKTGMGDMPSGLTTTVFLFALLHQFPFYLSVFNFVRLFLVHRNTYYGYSNKRVMHRTGFMGIDFKTIDYDKIQNIEVNVNPLERYLDVGSILIFSGEIIASDRGSRSAYTTFKSIKDPYTIFKKIKEVSVDIKTDWSYPNVLRPEENPGYKTKYKGD
jgi:membrane protein YdbS with pleckstrin-like domain